MLINKCNKNLIEYGEVGERVAGVDLDALRLSAISPHPSSPSPLPLTESSPPSPPPWSISLPSR